MFSAVDTSSPRGAGTARTSQDLIHSTASTVNHLGLPGPTLMILRSDEVVMMPLGYHKDMSDTLHPLMVLGATSNAGKSLVATAFCRWFHQQGYRVHPFKSQNMSLNAMVTPEGDEIGVAQYSQALAAGQVPSKHHNPILLTPQGNTTSQVIVRGQVHTTAAAKDYYADKDTYAAMALESFRTLQQTADVIVLEGAGSPVELNLMDRDIANLYMARHTEARCVLVVNIELGGFFASIGLPLLPN